MTPETPAPAVGQVWQDADPRAAGRRVRIVAIDGDRAVCALVVPRAGDVLAAKPGRRTRIRLDRFRPTRTGYQFVGEAS